MTELYAENLHTLLDTIDSLDKIASIDGVCEVEIRVRFEDVKTWAVVGYDYASGDPCVLRFEVDADSKPLKLNTAYPYTINQDYWNGHNTPWSLSTTEVPVKKSQQIDLGNSHPTQQRIDTDLKIDLGKRVDCISQEMIDEAEEEADNRTWGSASDLYVDPHHSGF